MAYGVLGAAVAWLIAQGKLVTGAQPKILDRREQARLSSKARPYTSTRAESSVYAVVLHQMGFSRGSDPAKYDAVTAHYKILPDGTIVWSHDWSVRLPHANGFNEGSVGVEFAGNFPSRYESNEDKHYYKPQKFGKNWLTPAQIASGRWLMRYLKSRGITHVLAHKQSSGLRGNDPGPDTWFHVGQWAVNTLGMKNEPSFTVGSGRPITDYWTSGPQTLADSAAEPSDRSEELVNS